MKETRDQGEITIDVFERFAFTFLSKDKKFVKEIYTNVGLDPRIPISREDFLAVYPTIKKTGMFNFIHDFADGFRKEYLNYDMETTPVVERKDEDPEIELSEKEQNVILAFFDDNIRGQESIKVVKTYRFLLKDIKNEELRELLLVKIIQ